MGSKSYMQAVLATEITKTRLITEKRYAVQYLFKSNDSLYNWDVLNNWNGKNQIVLMCVSHITEKKSIQLHDSLLTFMHVILHIFTIYLCFTLCGLISYCLI